jgi:hypothetical protein
MPYNNYNNRNIYLNGYDHFLTIEEYPAKKYHHIYLITIINLIQRKQK